MLKITGNIKPIIIALTWGILLVPATVFASFSDVPSSHPHYQAIKTLEQKGVIKGYQDGTFHPDQLITRAELLKIVLSDTGYKPEANKTYLTKYKDVPADSWFAPYVKKAFDLYFISINPDVPFFYPDTPIAKFETLKIIMSAKGIPAPYSPDGEPTGFTDLGPNSLYAYIARAALASGLHSQKDGNSFDPFKKVTRAEAAEYLYRADTYQESEPQNIFVINPDNVSDNYLSESEAKFIDNPKFPILLDIWSKINDEYINKDNLDTNNLMFGAIDGMVNTVGDPYTIFEKPEDAQSVENDLEGTFEGIGTVLDTFEDSFIIISVLKDSPAEKAGLLSGDEITAIDGKTIKDMSVEDVVKMIKGPAGTEVKLTIKRDTKILYFTITREELSIDTVIPDPGYFTKIPDDIGYIAIYQFTGSTAEEFTDIFKKTMDKNPKGLILDLRDNPGGYLDGAYSVLGHFIRKNDIIMNLKIAERVKPQLSDGEGEFLDHKIPMIILVNDGSASAAEVVAGALRDYKLGKLLGVQTYGKGTVQEVTTYTDGSFFKLSIAHWFTPLKKDIDKVGLTPDIIVERTKNDILNQSDTQLEKAVTELQKQF